jgi:hypothetical protein
MAMKFKFKVNINRESTTTAAAPPSNKVEVKFKVNGQDVSAKEGVWDMLHPDQVALKMLQQRIANVTCELHPIQCRHFMLKIVDGKVKFENVCCDAFRQKILQALQSQPPLRNQSQTS